MAAPLPHNDGFERSRINNILSIGGLQALKTII
jgi:hypothetical protein